ncbi:GGDEF domain-containing protein [Sporosarcina sp. BI001-red]|uniref:GGDEF domain-containing protein n=1 Tax=Sporosarcina sp. BI001-red TaxID=2282866 RepID=UPI000E261171|nr:GGDEF domain-containing protein [Sporosarcina sp. BI001-red]REB05987.1 GGDEF domain-containing protein [Sporosarcina sp. BI001-red]
MKSVTFWQRLQMPVAATVWLASAMVLLWHQTSENSLYGMLGFIGVAVLFFLVSDRMAFFAFIVLTLTTVFYFLYNAFVEGWSPSEQAAGIGMHFLFLLHLFALYSIAKYVYSYRSENTSLKKSLEELQEYISEHGVLTKREFEKQSSIVLSTMARHGEPGYFVQVDLSGIRKVARKQALIACSTVLFGTLRKHYDLVGHFDDKTIVVLLQNISDEGFKIVEERLKENIKVQIEQGAYEQINWNIRMVEGERSIEELLVTP